MDKLYSLLGFLSIALCVFGCGDSTLVAPALTTSQQQALEQQIGTALPTGASVIDKGDGGGRDASYGYYEWLIFSKQAIVMPEMQQPGVNGYLSLPLENATKLIESRTTKSKFGSPQSAFTSAWQRNGYEFSGTLLRTTNGDFLLVTRVKK